MAGSSLLCSTGTGAITIPQFLHVLQRTWLESCRFRPGVPPVLPRKLGLAVSGGADSMALAYLCKQWEKHNNSYTQYVNVNETSVTAFVVDHKARGESTQEANTVAAWLRGMGITTQILELQWLVQESSTGIPAFETQARRLRYQALGKACRDQRIEVLLMGHHQDDNVETAIWRLCSGAKGAGLRGIPAVARIPECHGLYGVSESGDSVTVHHDDFLLESRRQHEQWPDQRQKRGVEVSTGGILIARPLLSFPKSRLLETCRENNIPFVSDPTNFDPTLTPRNAIRSLLSRGVLPCALQNPSILSVIQKSQNLITDSHRLSDAILNSQCRLQDLSLASGSLTVQFHRSSSTSEPTTLHLENETVSVSPQRLNQLHSYTLRRVTELISPFPKNHFSLPSFADLARRVLPNTSRIPFSPKSQFEKGGEGRKPFTLGGVLFQPHDSNINNNNNKSRTTTSTTATANKHNHNHNHHGTRRNINNDNDDNTWLLTRQPFMRHREPVLRLPLKVPRHFSPSKETENQPQAPKKYQNYTPWTLWDCRFWFRVTAVPVSAPAHPYAQDKANQKSDVHGPGSGRGIQKGTEVATVMATDTEGGPTNYSDLQVVIRPLRQSDLSMLRRRKRDQRCINGTDASDFDVGAFLARLGREAPGQSRFTVPVLAIASDDMSGMDWPVVLPTMDLWFPSMTARPWTIKWDWKYKMIDLEALRLMGSP